MFSERKYLRPKVNGTNKRTIFQICEQERAEKVYFYAERKQIELKLNTFEKIRTDERNKSREYLYSIPCKEEEDRRSTGVS